MEYNYLVAMSVLNLKFPDMELTSQMMVCFRRFIGPTGTLVILLSLSCL